MVLHVFVCNIFSHSQCDNIAITYTNTYTTIATVADLGGFQGFHGTPFGFSCDRKLWKPGLQQNPTIKTLNTTNNTN